MWGIDNWSQLFWGGSVGVPTMQPLGWILLGAALVLAARRALRAGASRRAGWLTIVLLALVPLVAAAAQISVPHVFQNGTVADAGEVNANFDALVSESNAQDTRITGLETQAPLAACHWETVSSTGIGAVATGTCGGGYLVSGGCRHNSGSGRLVESASVANDDDPFTDVHTWRCEYDAVSQFDMVMLCCGP